MGRIKLSVHIPSFVTFSLILLIFSIYIVNIANAAANVPYPTPDLILIVSGNEQEGVVGQPLDEPFVVKILDNNKSPVAAASVKFEVTSGDGKLTKNPITDPTGKTSIKVLTNNTGKAGIRFIMGQSKDPHIVRVTAGDADPVQFVATIGNSPPQLAAIGNKTVEEGKNINFLVTATDPDDGDTVTLSVESLPANASFNPNTGVFNFNPNFDQAGTYAVKFIASDGHLTDSETVNITVQNVNRPPSFDITENWTVDENSQLTIALNPNDPDAETLSFSASYMPPGATLDRQGPQQSVFNWKPDYNTVISSSQKEFNITFTVTDPAGLTVSATTTITVNNVEPPPSADIDVVPLELDYGSVGLDSSKDRIFRIFNQGNALLNIQSIFSNNSQFALIAYSEEDEQFVSVTYSDAKANFVANIYAEDDPRYASIVMPPDSMAPVIITNSNDPRYMVEMYSEYLGVIPRVQYIKNNDNIVDVNYPGIAPAGNLLLVTRFTPTLEGIHEGKLEINSNDPDEPLVTVDVRGAGVPEPIISISPLNLDFGQVEIGQSSVRNLNVSNKGSKVLNIQNITSSNNQFTAPKPSGIIPGETKGVIVTYKPTTLGPVTGELSIVSDDPKAPVVTVSVQGTGLKPPEPDIRIETLSLNFGQVYTNSSLEKTFRIYNDGEANLDIADITSNNSQFTVPAYSDILPGENADVTVNYQPTTAGSHNALITVKSNDPDEPQKTITVQGEGVAPPKPIIRIEPMEINFGDVEIGEHKDETFAIHNDGNDILNVSSIASNNSQFQVSGSPNIDPGEVTYINIQFVPVSAGAKTGLVTVQSNDTDNSTKTIDVQGEGIVVPRPDIRIYPASVDYSQVDVGSSQTRNIRIYNDGDAKLWISTITSSSSQFIILDNPDVEAGEMKQLRVRFTPVSAGNKQATITINSNDPDESVVNVELMGEGVVPPAPEIRINPASLDFGDVDLSQSVTKKFRIYNDGEAALNITSITSSNSQFTILDNPSTIAVDGLSDVRVKFIPSSAGTKTASVVIASNDPDESSKVVPVQGVGIPAPVPDINVSPVSLNFGQVGVGAQMDKALRIYNEGDAVLNISSITSNSNHFTILNEPDIEPDSFADINVRFKPFTTGVKTGSLTISSNDPDENTVSVPLEGEGIHQEFPDIYVTTNILEFGDVEIGSSSQQSFQIYNLGDAVLQISDITSFDSRFVVLNKPNVAAGYSAVIQVRFSPVAYGTRSGTLTIKSNDPDESEVYITVVGNGIYPGYADVGVWNKVDIQNISQTMRDVFFINNDTGWLVGDNGLIASSDDSGDTWSLQNSNITKSLRGIHFTSQNNGWAVGQNGTILYTNNGGTFWSTYSAGGNNTLNDVYFMSNRGCIVGDDGMILTSYGSNDWIVRDSDTGRDLNAVCFASAYRGWIVGNSGTILHTTNGGNTWTQQYTGTNAALNGVDFVNTQIGWAVGSFGKILHTTNAGQTWTSQDGGIGFITLHDVDFINSNEGWIVGQNGIILYTDDGGETWINVDSKISNTINAVHFNDTENGWAVGYYASILKHYMTDQPVITSVSVTGSPAGAGDVITIIAQGTPGNTCSFSIAGVVWNRLMTENPSGTYRGTYTVSQGVNVTSATVTVVMTDENSNVDTDSSKKVTIDTQAGITSISVTGSPARSGDNISITIEADPDGSARFSIAGVVSNLVMTEGANGIYSANYTTPSWAYVKDAVLTISFTDESANTINNTNRKVSIYPNWDVNMDGIVDISDLTIVASKFGNQVATGDPSDINEDGTVDIFDLTTVSSHMGESAANASPAVRLPVTDKSQLAVLRDVYNSIDWSGNDPSLNSLENLFTDILGLRTAKFQLMQNYPNPCNPETWIPYSLSEAGDVVVKIYDSMGKLIRTLDIGHKNPGVYYNKGDAVYWDGKNEYGESISSGLYFYSIKCGEFNAMRKMMVRK
ncbi:choice-of-anchor D domain-containing protein [Candidatus Poribacteria bacterium]|nr:choice-of-anchor D domain-containing protein [Candidatus Poribacteria bacterium]